MRIRRSSYHDHRKAQWDSFLVGLGAGAVFGFFIGLIASGLLEDVPDASGRLFDFVSDRFSSDP